MVNSEVDNREKASVDKKASGFKGNKHYLSKGIYEGKKKAVTADLSISHTFLLSILLAIFKNSKEKHQC